MFQSFNVYCDESCHLENDCQKVMVLGAVWCPRERARDIAVQIRAIKIRHGLLPTFEIKWTKVSPGGLPFYLDIVNYFFDESDLHFRALSVPDKSELHHPEFQQTHDEWYYKMYYNMLKIILRSDAHYRIYLDIKDTRGGHKVARLHEILCKSKFDFPREIIQTVQLIRSHEVEVLQIADLLVGAISYVHRDLASSAAKLRLIECMRERSHYSLLRSTLPREDKVNLFIWRAS